MSSIRSLVLKIVPSLLCVGLLWTATGCSAETESPAPADEHEPVAKTAEPLISRGPATSPGGSIDEPAPNCDSLCKVRVCEMDQPCPINPDFPTAPPLCFIHCVDRWECCTA